MEVLYLASTTKATYASFDYRNIIIVVSGDF